MNRRIMLDKIANGSVVQSDSRILLCLPVYLFPVHLRLLAVLALHELRVN